MGLCVYSSNVCEYASRTVRGSEKRGARRGEAPSRGILICLQRLGASRDQASWPCVTVAFCLVHVGSRVGVHGVGRRGRTKKAFEKKPGLLGQSALGSLNLARGPSFACG